MIDQQAVIKAQLHNPNPSEADYDKSGKHRDHSFDQYKLYLELTDRISERRDKANGFFIALNTSIISILGITDPGGYGSLKSRYHVVACTVGVIISVIWWRLIRSYKDLNTAKFKVVHEMENFLPLRPYRAEWSAVEEGKNSSLYKPFSHIELHVPKLFGALYFLFGIYLLWFTASNSTGT